MNTWKSEEGGYTYESNTPAKIPNPVAEINETDRLTKNTRGIGDLYLSWNIFENLQYKFKAGIDAFYNKEQSFVGRVNQVDVVFMICPWDWIKPLVIPIVLGQCYRGSED